MNIKTRPMEKQLAFSKTSNISYYLAGEFLFFFDWPHLCKKYSDSLYNSFSLVLCLDWLLDSLLLYTFLTKDIFSRDAKSGHKFKFSGGLIWIVLHYPKREQSLFIYLFLEMVHNKNKHSKTPASKLKLMSWLRISGNHIFSTGFIEQKK